MTELPNIDTSNPPPVKRNESINMLSHLVSYCANHAMVVIAACTGLGATFGLASSLLSDSAYFDYDPIADGSMYGAFIGVVAWLATKFVASNFPTTNDSAGERKTLEEIVYPKFLIADKTNAKSRQSPRSTSGADSASDGAAPRALSSGANEETHSRHRSKLHVQRNMIGFGIILVGVTTIAQTIGSQEPIFAIVGGAVVAGLLAICLFATSVKLNRIRSTQPDEPERPA